MRIDIITCVPAIFNGMVDQSILKRAGDKGLAQIHIHDLRDYAVNKHNQIDDYAFGGGAGMVLMIEPIDKCIANLKSERSYDEVIYMSPDGEQLSQGMANELSLNKNIIMLCGHYKGVDERVREHLITREISIGDYVLTGGELAAAVVADSIVRLLPGVMNDETSALTDSFQDDLIAPPVYTRPAQYNNWSVPEVLTSGHQAKIEEWRFNQQVKRTKEKRPDLLKNKESKD
ncbi:MAG: tRNA (guanosine(37)-N1)-methyltransferase TrmD [Reichenbachiella sp.]|uniref:tRNA (guanosine(37)-N1)-methyltransferase TrmD n=1 Tax=Reichenbachiella sp. TaxID=2184521 RepID=UPI0032656A83